MPKQTISPDSFAMLCFLVLMQNGAGILDKSPDYVTEKTHMLWSGFNAFAYLDIHNMRKVVQWCTDWGIVLPTEIAEEMSRQNEAEASLREKGFEI